MCAWNWQNDRARWRGRVAVHYHKGPPAPSHLLIADAAVRAVANSALVRLVCPEAIQIGPDYRRSCYSPARVVEDKVDIGYSAPNSHTVLWSLKRGQPTNARFKDLCAAVAPKEFDLHIRLNLGHGAALMYAADLTEEYVEFNKGDVSDPASLGGNSINRCQTENHHGKISNLRRTTCLAGSCAAI